MNIAVIEDERKLAHALKEGLADEGHAVTVFYDGESAERHLSTAEETCDLIVLDLTLPGKDGFQVCRDLRTRGNTTPILVLTARGSIEDKVQALDSGADDYLVKPFSFEELLARNRALARRQPLSLTPQTIIGDLVMSVDDHRVTRAGKEIALTFSEFELLRFLMSEPGRVRTRDEIARTLWKIDDTKESNVVDVHLWNVRKKIDADYDTKYIRTIRGMGYALAKPDSE